GGVVSAGASSCSGRGCIFVFSLFQKAKIYRLLSLCDDARRLRRLRLCFWGRGFTVAPSRFALRRDFSRISEGNPPTGVSGFVLVGDAEFLQQPSRLYV